MHRHHEAIGILVGQRPQEHRVHDGEDGRRRTNPEAEREDAEKREAGFLDQNAEAVAKVAKECVHADSTVNADSRLARTGYQGSSVEFTFRVDSGQDARGWWSSDSASDSRSGEIDVRVADRVEQCAHELGPADRRSALRPDVCRHPIEELDLTVEEDDGHLRPRFVVNGRPTGLAPRLDRLAGSRGENPPGGPLSWVSADATCENSVLRAELFRADRPPGVRPRSDPKSAYGYRPGGLTVRPERAVFLL